MLHRRAGRHASASRRFIVTLALFLAWEGVELYALKNQSIGTTNFDIWFDLTHGNMAVLGGWLFFVVLAGGYLVFTFVALRCCASAPGCPATRSRWSLLRGPASSRVGGS